MYNKSKQHYYETSIEICITNIGYCVSCYTRVYCVCTMGVENSRYGNLSYVPQSNEKIYVVNWWEVSTQTENETHNLLIG